MVSIVVTKFYYVWKQAHVEVDLGDNDEVSDDDVWEAVESQSPEFKEIERSFEDSAWEYDCDW